MCDVLILQSILLYFPKIIQLMCLKNSLFYELIHIIITILQRESGECSFKSYFNAFGILEPFLSKNLEYLLLFIYIFLFLKLWHHWLNCMWNLKLKEKNFFPCVNENTVSQVNLFDDLFRSGIIPCRPLEFNTKKNVI